MCDGDFGSANANVTSTPLSHRKIRLSHLHPEAERSRSRSNGAFDSAQSP